MSDSGLNVAVKSIGRALAVLGRVLGWGILGAVCGVLLGFTNGVVHAPPPDPGYPLANEWYPVGVILIMCVECVVGLLLGAGVALGFRTPSGRRKAFAFALGGAVLGLGLGWFLARIVVLLVDWRDGSELVSNLVTQAAGAFGGIALAASRQPAGKKASPFTSAREADDV
jgi:hypothetical protein